MSDKPHTLQRFGLGLLFVAAFTILGQFLEFHGLFTGAESLFSRLLLARPGNSTQALPVAVIEIDDDSYRDFFGGDSPLNAPQVWSLVQAIGKTFQPAVIGVDLLTEENAYSRFEVTQLETPVVWAAGLRSPAKSIGVHFGKWLLGHDDSVSVTAGEVLGRSSPEKTIRWGIPFFDVEEDGTVRRARRTWKANGDPKTSDPRTNVLARQIVKTYCDPPETLSTAEKEIRDELCEGRDDAADEFFLRAATIEPPSWKLTQLFDCRPEAHRAYLDWPQKPPCEWESLFPSQEFNDGSGTNEISLLTQQKGRPIILLGGTYAAARDSYASLRAKGTPGVMLNARAVQIELEGNPVTEFPRMPSVLIDFALGCVPLLMFGILSQREWVVRIPLWGAATLLLRAQGWSESHQLAFDVLLLLGQVVVSVALFFLFGSLWLSWIPALLSGFAWQGFLEDVIFGESHSPGVPA